MGNSPATGAASIGTTADGCLRAHIRRAVTTVQVKKAHVPSTANGFQTRRRDQSRAEWSRPRKKSRTEVEESELESDGSGEDGWRVRGLQSIAFGLLGLKESDNERNELLREQNELWREQNGYLRRIAEQLESGLGPEEVLDSTMRE